MRKIVIALPKGKGNRLLPQAYGVFKTAGLVSGELENEIENQAGKQLEFASECGKSVFLLVRPADIPKYVDRNWADMGISGFDCYREYELSNVTAQNSLCGDNFLTDILPDLHLCDQSRFCVAGRPETQAFYAKCKKSSEKILTVATQSPKIAERYFAGAGIIADIVTVSGSAELMPRHGDVDVIFDIVETGGALGKNGLIVFEEAMLIQTKLLVSKAALKYDGNVSDLVEKIKSTTKGR